MFSETVDKIISRTGRGNELQTIADYVNTTLREVNSLGDFMRDMQEAVVTATADPHVWTRPLRFKRMVAVEYPQRGGQRIFPQHYQPGRMQTLTDDYYYGGPTYFAFNNVRVDEEIRVAYIEKPRKFVYFEEGSRPAVYDQENETWSYLLGGAYVSTLGTEELDEAARDKVTHWVLDDWQDVAIQGALAKITLQFQSREQAGPAFALYKSLGSTLVESELIVSVEG